MKWFASLFVSFALVGLMSQAQVSTLPTQAEVGQLIKDFQSERAEVVNKGVDKRFLPEFLKNADALAKRATVAAESGRFLQAVEAIREARWQLPYQSPQVPENNVALILGNLRLRHAGEINAVAFSPDGQRLASGSRDQTVKIWDMANGHELLTYTKHQAMVRTLAFSPDGKFIASAGSEKDLRLWDALTGKDIRIFEGKGLYVTTLAFSKDGKHLISGQASRAGSKNMLCIYEVATGKLLREIDDFRLLPQNITFSPDGSRLAVAAGDGELRLWQYPEIVEIPDRPAYWTQQDPNGAAYHVSISNDGSLLARCGADGLKIYNLPQPNPQFKITSPRFVIQPPQDHRFSCSVFSKDDKTLFTGCTDGVIRLYEPSTGQAAGTFKGHNAGVRSLVFNKEGNQLASGSADFTIRLWNFDIVLQAREYAGAQSPVWKSSFSPDGSRIVSASADRSVRIFDFASGEIIHTLSGHTAPVTYALFSPDGSQVASAGGDKVIRLWTASDGKPLRVLEGHTGTITAIDYAPDGSRIASGSTDKTLRIWDPATGKTTVTAPLGTIIAAVAFSADGKQVAAGGIDDSIHLIDAATGKVLHEWSAHSASVSGLDFSPDGKYLASCSMDQLVRLWPLATPGKSSITLVGHTGPLSAVAFRKDSKFLVSCGSDRLVKLWKLENGSAKEMQNYRGHGEWVTSVAFSKDGHYFVSSGVDRSIKVWEITSREIPLRAEHTGAVYAVAVSPDGKLIASAGTDLSIKLWDRATGREIATMTGHAGSVSSLAFTPDSKTLVSGSYDRNVRLWDVDKAALKPLVPKQQQSWTGFLTAIPLMTVSPDSKRLIVWEPGNERYIKINVFDLASGEEAFSFNDSRNVIAVSFAGNGKVVATAGKNGAIRLFDLDKSGQMFPGGDWILYQDEVTPGDLALSRDASFLIVGSSIGQVKFCSVKDRKVLHTIKGHEGFVNACQVSPDGKLAVTLGEDNIIKLWDTATAKELRRWDLTGSIPGARSLVLGFTFTPDSKQIVTANANTTLFVLDCP